MRLHCLLLAPALVLAVAGGCGQPFETATGGAGGGSGTGGSPTSSSSSSSSSGVMPSSFVGTWGINITDEANGCAFSNWTQGGTFTGTKVTIALAQGGTEMTATVSGIAADLLDGLLGTHVFVGPSSGSPILLTANGGIQAARGGCTAEWNADVELELSGTTLTGKITYSPSMSNCSCTANAAATCSCTTVQTFMGKRG